MRENWINKVSYKGKEWLSTTQAFVVMLVIFALNALWLAFSATYPLPFDEYYHFGIIQYYAQQWSPFISAQTPEASLYGDITRYPSYLFHYLMSFPYRLIDGFIPGEDAQIITLRIMNIMLFVGGIVLFRHLFLRAKVPRWIIHLAVLLFAVTPIVPFLAAHINYDNLMTVITPLYLLLGYSLLTSKNPRLRTFILLVSLGLMACLVKETFLPLLATGVGYIVVVLAYRWRSKPRALFRTLFDSFSAETVTVKVALIICLLVSFGLFTERYVQNQLYYGGYGAPCAAVQPESVCKDYGPWYRNNQNKLFRPDEALFGNPVSFTQHWVSKVMRGYYAIFSHTPTKVVSEHEPFGPIEIRPLLPIPIVVGYMGLLLFMGTVAVQARRLWRHDFYRYLLVLTSVNIGFIWLFNYLLYLELGAAQAIQARYTLPLMLGILVIGIQAVAWTIRPNAWRIAIATVIIVPYFAFGGVAGWLIRAEPTWFWQRPRVIEVNQRASDILKQLVPH